MADGWVKDGSSHPKDVVLHFELLRPSNQTNNFGKKTVYILRVKNINSRKNAQNFPTGNACILDLFLSFTKRYELSDEANIAEDDEGIRINIK